MKSAVSRSVVFAALSVALVGSAWADGVWYLQKSGHSKYQGYVADDLSYWAQTEGGAVGSGAPTASDELVVLASRQLRLGTASKKTTCKSLTLGDGTAVGNITHDNGTQTFANDGLFMNNNTHYQANLSNARLAVAGKITILAAAATPAVFHQQQEKYAGTTLNVTAKVYGDAGTGILIGKADGTYVSTNTTIAFTQLTNYKGSIEVKAGRYQEITDENFGQKAVLSTMTTPGSVRVSTPGCILALTNVSCVVQAANVSISSGCRLELQADAEGQSGKLVATDSLTLPQSLEICLVGYPQGAAGLTLIEGPRGCGLDQVDFALSGVPSLGSGPELKVVKTATTESLKLAWPDGWVQMVKSDQKQKDKGTGQSAITNKLSWSDGKVPHDNAVYVIPSDFAFRTPVNTEVCDFPGDGIVLAGVGCGILYYGKGLSLDGCLCVPAGASAKIWTGQSAQNGDCVLTANSIQVDGTLNLGSYNKSAIVLDGPLAGSGEIVMDGVDGSSADAGVYSFTNNSASTFKGRLRVSLHQKLIDLGRTNQTFNINRQIDFGVDRDAFDYRGFMIEHGGHVVINPDGSNGNNYTYTAPANLGMCVNSLGEVNVRMGVGNLIWPAGWTLNGTFVKRGSGRLALGGPMRFVGANGQLSETPVEGKNVFEWQEGVLQPLVYDALDGARVELTATSQNGYVKLRLAVDFDNANLTRYGIRNAKTKHPFSIAHPDVFPTLPLDLQFPDGHPDEMEFTVGVLTVDPDAVAEVSPLIPALPKQKIYRGYAQTPSVVTNADGSVTLGIKFERRGLVVIFK